MPEGKQNVGSPGYGGPIATARGLVFIGATGDQRFRAFDSRTGEELWSDELPYTITAVPISYADEGRRSFGHGWPNERASADEASLSQRSGPPLPRHVPTI